jgi:hypothetical protein
VGGVFVRDCGGWPGAFLAGDGVGGWLGRQPGDGLRASFITCVRGVIDLRLAAVGPEPPPSAEIDLRLRAMAEKPIAQPGNSPTPRARTSIGGDQAPSPSQARNVEHNPDHARTTGALGCGRHGRWSCSRLCGVQSTYGSQPWVRNRRRAPKSTYGSPPWPRNPSLRPETRPRVGDGAPAGRDRAREPSPGQEPLRTRPTAHGPRNASHTPASSFRNRHRTT